MRAILVISYLIPWLCWADGSSFKDLEGADPMLIPWPQPGTNAAAGSTREMAIVKASDIPADAIPLCPPSPVLPKGLAKIEVLEDEEFGYWVEVTLPKQYKPMEFASLYLIEGAEEEPSFYVPVKVSEDEDMQEYAAAFGVQNPSKKISIRYSYYESHEEFCLGGFGSEQSSEIHLR